MCYIKNLFCVKIGLSVIIERTGVGIAAVILIKFIKRNSQPTGIRWEGNNPTPSLEAGISAEEYQLRKKT